MNNVRGKYKTKQRELILLFLKSESPNHITAEVIAEKLKGQVGLATVYRNLDELVKEGSAIKYDAPNGVSACYRHVNDEAEKFYHFLCVDCGQMSHISCNKFNDLSEHIKHDHGITLDLHKTVLYGSCQACDDNPLVSEEKRK